MIGENNFIGKQIDTFRLITELSSGELDTTYKAEQVQVAPRIVVFKLFHSVQLPEIQRTRFQQEIRLLKKVKHPHILPVLDGGFYENSPYSASEYVAHGSLRDRLNALTSPFLPMQEAIAIISDIGRALQFFHQINITHSNLKPENILFHEDGELLLADSSITTIQDSVPIELAHNTNTFPYMAPEQFLGRANKESDQYALGCIAYELLTGIAPFAGSAFRNMANTHANEVLVPPTQLNMLLPEYMQKAILTAMAKQETDRYPHIKDFIAALTGSAKAQNVPIIVPSLSTIPPAPAPQVPPVIQQPQEDSAVTLLQDVTLPDTPTTLTVEDIQPVTPFPQEPLPAVQPPTLRENREVMDFLPDTPAQPVEDAEMSKGTDQSETYDVIEEERFLGTTYLHSPILQWYLRRIMV